MHLTTYVIWYIIEEWDVLLHEEFDSEFDNLPEAVQDEMLAHANCSSSLARSWAGLELIPLTALATRI
jgi:hypothetical protein